MKFHKAGRIKDYIQFEDVLITKDEALIIDSSRDKLFARTVNCEHSEIFMLDPSEVRLISHECMDKPMMFAPREAIIGNIELEDGDKVIRLEDYVATNEKNKRNKIHTLVRPPKLIL